MPGAFVIFRQPPNQTKQFGSRSPAARASQLRNRHGGFFLKAAELVFQLRYAVVEAFQNFPRLGRNGHTVLAMVARGGAAFDGIIKFLAAGATGALARAGSGWVMKNDTKLLTFF